MCYRTHGVDLLQHVRRLRRLLIRMPRTTYLPFGGVADSANHQILCVVCVHYSRPPTVYLIHQTAKEFVLADNQSWELAVGPEHCLDLDMIEAQKAQICIAVSSVKDVFATIQCISQRPQLVVKNAIETFVAYADGVLAITSSMRIPLIEDSRHILRPCFYDTDALRRPM